MVRRLTREATVAGPGFNRWLVPPAAIAVHMCIGQVYGFSVFKKPLAKALGDRRAHRGRLVGGGCRVAYSIALALLGLSAAVCGKWVERSGPRKTMIASMICFCSGLVLSSLAVRWHSLWLLYVGYGLIGGDRPRARLHLAGFDADEMVPRPPGHGHGHGDHGIRRRRAHRWSAGGGTDEPFHLDHLGRVRRSMLVMAGLYAISMLFGAWIVRVPPEGWKPAGWAPSASETRLITNANVGVDVAWKTPQFWMLWVVLCMNVSAGIGILGQASPMIQDMFGVTPAAAAAMSGCFRSATWAAASSGRPSPMSSGARRSTASTSSSAPLLYLSVPWIQGRSRVTLFVVVTGLILTMYGGGFATIPAYLRDLFGSHQVGAIHGRLITAWSMAAIIGPSSSIASPSRTRQPACPAAKAYNPILYLMAGLLGLGLIANLLVRPVDRKYHLAPTPEPRTAMKTLSLVIAWTWVALPLGWGVYQSVQKSLPLFGGGARVRPRAEQDAEGGQRFRSIVGPGAMMGRADKGIIITTGTFTSKPRRRLGVMGCLLSKSSMETPEDMFDPAGWAHIVSSRGMRTSRPTCNRGWRSAFDPSWVANKDGHPSPGARPCGALERTRTSTGRPI